MLKGNPRETDPSKWVSRKNFSSLVSGTSHRKNEYAIIGRGKDEPYVMQSKQIDFRARDKSREIDSQEFRVKTGGTGLKSGSVLAQTPSIRQMLADKAIKKVNEYNRGDKCVSMIDCLSNPSSQTPSNHHLRLSAKNFGFGLESTAPRTKNKIYLKSISSKVAVDRSTGGKKNEPMKLIMSESKKKLFV